MFDNEMVSEQIAREYAKKVDEVIERKLIALSYKALQEREYKLYDILHEIENGNINEETLTLFKERLHEEGYILHVDMPEATLNESTIRVEHTEGADESTAVGIDFNPNDIKISIYKEIIAS